jgi:eukaryotic-like serine/threonine-protein kinase
MSDRDAQKSPKPFGAYELLEKIGIGGMGSVYKARLYGRHDLIAIKVANAQVAGDAILSQRFENEFKLASHLQHPNLVRALGHGLEDGVPYLLMEFVPGRSLDKLIQEKGPMPIPEALAAFEQVAAGLTYIHQNHLIHRDIKPGNILIEPTGRAKLADLGLIKDLESQTMLTVSRMGLGTMEYSAPEQFDDAKHVDVRSDIYGLGAALYVALTGRFPFGPGSQMRVLMHKLEHQFIPISQLLEGVRPALEQLINRSLHPDPAQRPASIREFLTEMRSTAAPISILTPKPMPKNRAIVEKRRKGKRHPIRLNTTLSIADAVNRQSWHAQIMDISVGGLCLQLPRRFEANTLINVFLPDEQTGDKVARLVRVRWVKNAPDKTYLHGCIFVNPLENQDVDQFLFNDTATTSMLRKPKVMSDVSPPFAERR